MLRRYRWYASMLVVLLLAEGLARILGGHVAAVDQRGHPELERKWFLVKQFAAAPASATKPTVVTFGNSMMDGGFIPSVFAATQGGDPAFNAGFLNAPLVTIAPWSKMVIDRLHATTAIVMIDPLDTVKGSDVSFGEDGGTLAASFEDALKQLTPGTFDRMTQRAEKASALVKYRTTLRQPHDLWQAIVGAVHHDPRPKPQRIDEAAPLHDIDWTTALDADGWDSRFKDGALPPNAKFPLDFVGKLIRTTDFDSGPVRAVFTAIRRARTAVLVIPPVATEILDRSGIPATFMAARVRDLARLARAAGVQVIDLTRAGYPPSLFHDPVHLNRAGAERMSRDIALALHR